MPGGAPVKAYVQVTVVPFVVHVGEDAADAVPAVPAPTARAPRHRTSVPRSRRSQRSARPGGGFGRCVSWLAPLAGGGTLVAAVSPRNEFSTASGRAERELGPLPPSALERRVTSRRTRTSCVAEKRRRGGGAEHGTGGEGTATTVSECSMPRTSANRHELHDPIGSGAFGDEVGFLPGSGPREAHFVSGRGRPPVFLADVHTTRCRRRRMSAALRENRTLLDCSGLNVTRPSEFRRYRDRRCW